MVSADGKYVITFNGEIYNYQLLRKQLELKGYHFRSQSDTEVLLHLYAEKGESMVHDLRGMYAFAIWDEHKKVCSWHEILLVLNPFIMPMMAIPSELHHR